MIYTPSSHFPHGKLGTLLPGKKLSELKGGCSGARFDDIGYIDVLSPCWMFQPL